MRGVLTFAGVVAAAGLAMAQIADRMTAPAPVAHAAKTQIDKSEIGRAQAGPSNRSFNIARDRRGHFATDARIDGQRIGVMIDTGASMLALNESSAARIGVYPRRSDYNALVSTANGAVRGARAMIPTVDVGGLVVRNVEALVLPDEALSENLLGLSYLSRLKRFEFAGGNLVLEQ